MNCEQTIFPARAPDEELPKREARHFVHYRAVLPGRFVSRPNRSTAYVEIAGDVQICHVKNTGRCAELLVPGARVYLECAPPGRARKTKYDLVAVEKGPRLINLDSQAPNRAAQAFLQGGRLLGVPCLLRAEAVWEESRFDFYMEAAGRRVFVEVKGVTLEEDGLALFPDAPTLRGVKHLRGLARAAARGFECYVLFVVQMEGVTAFAPNRRTHPQFADALCAAQAAGVHVLAYDCVVTPASMALNAPVPLRLEACAANTHREKMPK